uniref:Uncharacterized protein n=1 Tax=Romanomermis culicivorax TaxID=13658 RepID=A0A915IV40_ROMCU
MAEDLSVSKGVKRRVGVMCENKDAPCCSSQSTSGETVDSILDLSVKKCRSSLSCSSFGSASHAMAPAANDTASLLTSVCLSSTRSRRPSVTPLVNNIGDGLCDSFSPTSNYQQLLNSTMPSSSAAAVSTVQQSFAASPITNSKNIFKFFTSLHCRAPNFSDI